MACIVESCFQGVDDQTADLILQLQLEDAELYSSKGKHREGEVSDELLAFQLQRQELERMSALQADIRMARSIASAVVADGHLFSQTISQEDIAARDHSIARQFTDDQHPPNQDYAEADIGVQSFDDELLEKLQAIFVSGIEDTPEELGHEESELIQAESSAWATGRISKPSSRTRQCEACREEVNFADVARCPCQHEYCRACLENLFESSMRDESLFPPRCCRQPIPVSTPSIRIFLKSELVRAFEKKKIEFETPNRTYCHSPKCAAFISTQDIDGSIATCPDCGMMTCTECKAEAHEGDCPNDTGLQQVLDLALENSWQRCGKCWRIVQLDWGCNHMTCLCRNEFCYRCGLEWHTCSCQDWDPHRLRARANQILNRVAAAPVPVAVAPEPPQIALEVDTLDELPEAPAPVQTARERLLAQTMENLRGNHECGHSKWRWIRGSHQCEECYKTLPEYIFECRQCQLWVCNRCRRNRL